MDKLTIFLIALLLVVVAIFAYFKFFDNTIKDCPKQRYESCKFTSEPVCGNDNITYSNKCIVCLTSSGAESWKAGKC